MRTYEKPRLMALSLSGSDALCACSIDAVGSNMDIAVKQMLENLGLLDGDKPREGTFAPKDQCDKDKEVNINGYCKHGPSGEMLFNS